MRRHKKQRTNELPRHTVGYVRVSTEEQGICGLGIQAQSAGITRKAEELGLQLVKIYEEVASGTSTDRPQMVAALDHAAGMNPAGCVIAWEMSRISRKFKIMAYIADRTERDGTKLIICDIPKMATPHHDRFLWRLMANVSELEVEEIQAKTKDRLNVVKMELLENGFYDTRPKKDKPSKRIHRLGNPNIEKISALGGAAMKQNTRAFALKTFPIIEKLRKKGITGLRAIARELNNRNGLHGEGRAVLTYQGQRQRDKLEEPLHEDDLPQWSAEQVKRIIKTANTTC